MLTCHPPVRPVPPAPCGGRCAPTPTRVTLAALVRRARMYDPEPVGADGSVGPGDQSSGEQTDERDSERRPCAVRNGDARGEGRSDHDGGHSETTAALELHAERSAGGRADADGGRPVDVPAGPAAA